MKKSHIYLSSIAILVIAAFFSTGYYHSDEHFQILEFAGLKLNMTVPSNLPWEFHNQMRSTIQPAMVVLVFGGLQKIGMDSPFTLTIILRLLSAAIAFLGMWLVYKAYNKTIVNDTLRKWFLLLSFFMWFMIHNNVRFSSEGWSGSIFLIAFALLIINPHRKGILYLYVGFLLGFSFLLRYQTGFLIAGLILWHLFVQKKIGHVVLLLLGVVVLIGVGILIDTWFYGEWTLTTWNYLDQNILQNKVSGFGVKPWWYYFENVFVQAIPPFSVVMIASVIIFFVFRRSDLLTWAIFPFLLIHFVIGHKEIRFLFPIIGLLPIMIIKSLEIVEEKWRPNFSNKPLVLLTAKLCWVANILFLAVITFMPADNQISLYDLLYTKYNEPITLYYTHDNPYHRALDVYFYKRKDLEVVKLSAANQVDRATSGKKLFVTKDRDVLKDIKSRKRLIYSSFPDWIWAVNFNSWIERTNCWYVYELN